MTYPRGAWLSPLILILTLALGFGWMAPAARAEVQRFAVLVGNNEGDEDDPALRHAESDAARVHDVLRELGDFPQANMVLLQGQPARAVEETLIAFNERVRAAVSHEGTQVLLFVYYSGHADGESFHLGGTRLAARLLTQLVSGSAATFRLLVLDACRAGAFTRQKGGRVVRGQPPLSETTLPGNGLAVLAASAAHEDAQESDELAGSFFTHALVSGLMGAADHDADGAVSLGEAYEYAYATTLRATSRTQFGSQHPTFRFEFAGQGALVLTEPDAHASTRAVLSFPAHTGFLVMREHAHGPVVAEVGPHDIRRSLSLKPGRYFLRGRGTDVLFEGHQTLSASSTSAVDLSQLKRIEYARLVRKGGGQTRDRSQSLKAGAWLRSRLSNADGACAGGYLGYSLELAHLGIHGRAGACTARFRTERLSAVVNEFDLELRLSHTWDVSILSLDVGLGGGGALFTQRFETTRTAPPRNSASPYLLVQAGMGLAMGRFGVGLDLSGETHFLRLVGSETIQFALRASAELAVSF